MLLSAWNWLYKMSHEPKMMFLLKPFKCYLIKWKIENLKLWLGVFWRKDDWHKLICCNLKVQIILNVYTVILSITNKWSHLCFATEMEAMKVRHPWEHTVAQIHLQESSLTATNYGYNLRVTSLAQGLDSQLTGMDHWPVNGKELSFLENLVWLVSWLPCFHPVFFFSCILSLLSCTKLQHYKYFWINSRCFSFVFEDGTSGNILVPRYLSLSWSSWLGEGKDVDIG